MVGSCTGPVVLGTGLGSSAEGVGSGAEEKYLCFRASSALILRLGSNCIILASRSKASSDACIALKRSCCMVFQDMFGSDPMGQAASFLRADPRHPLMPALQVFGDDPQPTAESDAQMWLLVQTYCISVASRSKACFDACTALDRSCCIMVATRYKPPPSFIAVNKGTVVQVICIADPAVKSCWR